MKPVICFGEALIDLLQINTPTVDGLPLADFRQFPGGAPANAAVAVAKLGGKAFFAGQVGKDSFGDFLIKSLKHYGVDCSTTYQHPSAKTALAFVSLDQTGERSFAFYRDASADVLIAKSQIKPSWFSPNSIFHICSNTLTDANIAASTNHAVDLALDNNCLTSFDVNLRHNLWPTGSACREQVNALVKRAHVVKFAKEELEYLAERKEQKQAYIDDCLKHSCQLLIVTDGANPLNYYSRKGKGQITPPTTKVIDSTAAGDGFIGGVLYGLSQFEQPFQCLSKPDIIEYLLTAGSHCGAFAASRQGAFVALATIDDIPQLANQQLEKITTRME